MKVLVILSDGFEELEAIGSIALLKRSGLKVDIYALNNTKATGKHGLILDALYNLSNQEINLAPYDCLLLPGGPHYTALMASTQVQKILEAFLLEHKLVAAICAAPTILGHLGYLKNKNYTCFTSMNEDFKGTYIDQYVVVDDNIITARSAAASIDFAFAIIHQLQGPKQEEKIKQEIYY